MEIDDDSRKELNKMITFVGSPYQFSQQLGIKHTTIRDWLSGKTKSISDKNIKKIGQWAEKNNWGEDDAAPADQPGDSDDKILLEHIAEIALARNIYFNGHKNKIIVRLCELSKQVKSGEITVEKAREEIKMITTESAPAEIQPGSIVKLNSDSPLMTVAQIQGNNAVVVWFCGDQLGHGTVDLKCLTLVKNSVAELIKANE